MKTKTAIPEIHREVLKGKNAKLLKEAIELIQANKTIQTERQEAVNKAIKAYNEKEAVNNKRLTEIKTVLNEFKDGEYMNKAGNMVIIETKEQRSWPTPQDVKKYLKSNRMGKLFDSVVKVQMGDLKKIMPEEEINKITIVIDKIKNFKFK